jgi:hypothetical protein
LAGWTPMVGARLFSSDGFIPRVANPQFSTFSGHNQWGG